MVAARPTPYVSVTSIAPLLAGQEFCDFRPWFMAHWRDFERQPSAFNGAAWRAKHSALVRKTAEWQRQDGSTVFVEAQNRFILRGESGVVVAFQPDLIRIRGDQALVTDCKTGRPLDSHIAQVKLYMLLLPHVRLEYRPLRFSGRVQYDGDAYDIAPEDIDEAFREQFRQTIALIGSDLPPWRT